MADAEARREARRRKILQNSESRINRLLGTPDSTVSGAGHGDKHNDTASEELPDKDTVIASPSKVQEPDIKKPFVQNHSTADELQTQIHQGPQKRIVSNTDSGRLTGSPVNSNSANHIPSVDKSNSNIGTSSSVDSPRSQKQDSAHMDPLRILDLLRAGGCVLAAFVTRWSLSFGLGLLFCEWILLPFLVLEGSLYYFQTTHMKDIQLPHKSSMMAGALILSGVKPDVIATFNKIMGYTTAVSEDVALYLFTFLIFHGVME